jgi:hypothetical protein
MVFLRESIAANSREGKFPFRLRQYRVTADRLGYQLAQLAQKRAEEAKAAGHNPGVSV